MAIFGKICFDLGGTLMDNIFYILDRFFLENF